MRSNLYELVNHLGRRTIVQSRDSHARPLPVLVFRAASRPRPCTLLQPPNAFACCAPATTRAASPASAAGLPAPAVDSRAPAPVPNSPSAWSCRRAVPEDAGPDALACASLACALPGITLTYSPECTQAWSGSVADTRPQLSLTRPLLSRMLCSLPWVCWAGCTTTNARPYSLSVTPRLSE